MRKTTESVCKAFLAGNRKSSGNSSTDGVVLLLHGNRIAERMPDGSIMATLAGWPSPTTRERLNGLTELLGLGRLFHQHKHVQHFRNKPIGSNDTIVLTRPEGKPVS